MFGSSSRSSSFGGAGQSSSSSSSSGLFGSFSFPSSSSSQSSQLNSNQNKEKSIWTSSIATPNTTALTSSVAANAAMISSGYAAVPDVKQEDVKPSFLTTTSKNPFSQSINENSSSIQIVDIDDDIDIDTNLIGDADTVDMNNTEGTNELLELKRFYVDDEGIDEHINELLLQVSSAQSQIKSTDADFILSQLCALHRNYDRFLTDLEKSDVDVSFSLLKTENDENSGSSNGGDNRNKIYKNEISDFSNKFVDYLKRVKDLEIPRKSFQAFVEQFEEMQMALLIDKAIKKSHENLTNTKKQYQQYKNNLENIDKEIESNITKVPGQKLLSAFLDLFHDDPLNITTVIQERTRILKEMKANEKSLLTVEKETKFLDDIKKLWVLINKRMTIQLKEIRNIITQNEVTMQVSFYDEMLEQYRRFIKMYVEFEVEAKEGKDAFNKEIREGEQKLKTLARFSKNDSYIQTTTKPYIEGLKMDLEGIIESEKAVLEDIKRIWKEIEAIQPPQNYMDLLDIENKNSLMNRIEDVGIRKLLSQILVNKIDLEESSLPPLEIPSSVNQYSESEKARDESNDIDDDDDEGMHDAEYSDSEEAESELNEPYGQKKRKSRDIDSEDDDESEPVRNKKQRSEKSKSSGIFGILTSLFSGSSSD